MNLIVVLIKRKITTVMIFSGICLMGIISASELPVELMPDIELPVLTVITPFENAAPSEIEKLVTERIEEAVTAVSGVSEVKSESIEGISIVRVVFEWGRDMDMALIGVKEKVDLIRGELPDDAGKSIVVKYDPSDEPVMIYSVTLAKGDTADTRRRAEKEILPFIERINGVSMVELIGGDKREILVEADNSALYSKNISLPEILNSIAMSNYSYPAGSVLKGGKEYLVRTDGEFRNRSDIRSVVVGYNENGIPVYLSDVANVNDTFKEKKSVTRFNGKDSVALLVKKEPGKNTINTCDSVKKVMAGFFSTKNGTFDIRCIYDQSIFIRSSINSVIEAAFIGGIISFFVIWFFLKNFIPPLIISLSIPVSVAGTMVMMKLFNISLNTMSLGGLAVGIGTMVDSGIVILESIEGVRVRERTLSGTEAAITGTLEVAAPVTASIFSSIIVFLPIVFLSGLSGAVFRDLALTVSFSHIFSLVSSLTLIPMLSGVNFTRSDKFLSGGNRYVRESWSISALMPAWEKINRRIVAASDPVMNRLSESYISAINYALSHQKKVIAAGCAAMLTGFFLFIFVKSELMPSVDSGEILVEIELPGGTPLAETASVCEIFEKYIGDSSKAEYVFTKAGCDPDDNISEKISGRGTDYALLKIYMKDGQSSEKFIEGMKRDVKLNESIKITYRLREDIVASVFTAESGKTDIEVYGKDPDDLKESGANIRNAIISCAGIKNITSVFDRENPELLVDIDRKTAATLGLNAEQVASQVGIAVRGEVSSTYRDGDDEVDIRLRLAGTDRYGIDSLKRILVKTSSGSVVPVSKFAEIKTGSGSGRIVRKEQSRINIVTAELIPGAESVAEEMRKILEGIKFRDGVSWKIADGADRITEAFRSLGFAMALAVLFIYMLLAGQLQSLGNPLIIMISIPVTALGVSAALLFTGETLNINSGMGIILLSGTVVNNAIVLFDFIDKEFRNGSDIKIAVIEAGSKRLKPILMTTLTTVLALVPIALGLGEGAELQRPMAVTVIGGMTVSTILTLVFIPVLFSAINKRRNAL